MVSIEQDEGEWADHTYSISPSETLIVLYGNKAFQCTVGQRLKCTMGGTFSEQAIQSSSPVQRTYWKKDNNTNLSIDSLCLFLKVKLTTNININLIVKLSL